MRVCPVPNEENSMTSKIRVSVNGSFRSPFDNFIFTVAGFVKSIRIAGIKKITVWEFCNSPDSSVKVNYPLLLFGILF